MSDIKSIIAKNIVELRQEKGMTQLELANRLNYSDKAVSKWEHADSMPDVTVLVAISEVFGVTLDYLVQEEHKKVEKEVPKQRTFRYSKKVITALSISLVWLVAMLFFVILSLWQGSVGWNWLCFIYALPIQTIVWLVFSSVWFRGKGNYVLISLLVWSSLLAIHLTLQLFDIRVGMIYLLGIPGQIIILLWSILKRKA